MQDPQPPRLEVLARARQPDQLAVLEVQGDRVDGEVAPLEVLAQGRAELNLRQRPRALVALAARAREVEGHAVELDRGGSEPLVRDDTTADAPRDLERVALDHEVELVRLAAQQQVAHGARRRRRRRPRPRARRRQVNAADPRGASWRLANLHGVSSEPPRWYRRRLVIVLGALVAVLVCAAAVFALTRPGDVFNADVEFFDEPSQTSVPTPEPVPETPKKGKKKDPLAGLPVADLRLLEGPPALPADRAVGAAAVQDPVEPPVRRPARVPADHRRQPALHGRQRRRGRGPQPHDRQAGLAARPGLPGRLLARLRRQAHLRDDPRAHEGRPAGGSPRSTPRPARSRGRSRCPAAASPRRCSSTVASTSGPRTGPSTRCARRTAARSGGSRPAARSRAAPRWPAASSTSGPTAATSTRSASAAASRSGARAPAAPTSASARATSTPPRPSPTGACTSATPTATCTRSRRPAASWPGAAGPAPTSTPRRPWPRCATASRRSTSGRTTGPSTRSTPAAAPRAGRTATAARSPAPPPWSATSSTTPTGATATRPACGRGRATWPGTAIAAPSTRSCPTARPSTSRASPRSPRCCPRRTPRSRPRRRGRRRRRSQGEGGQEAQGGQEEGGREEEGGRQEAQGREEAAAAQQQRLAAGRTSGL